MNRLKKSWERNHWKRN